MKKIGLAIVLFLIVFFTSNAQDTVQFGVTGGFINGSGKASIAGFDIAEVQNGSGFFIGLLADIGVAEKFSVQPEILYAGIDGEGIILIPVMAKYYIAEKFNIQAGPQLDFLTGLNELEKNLLKTTGFSLGFGAGFDINENFAVQARYNVGLNNRIDGDLTTVLDDFDIPIIGDLFNINPDLKVNTFQIGLVYNFN